MQGAPMYDDDDDEDDPFAPFSPPPPAPPSGEEGEEGDEPGQQGQQKPWENGNEGGGDDFRQQIPRKPWESGEGREDDFHRNPGFGEGEGREQMVEGEEKDQDQGEEEEEETHEEQPVVVVAVAEEGEEPGPIDVGEGDSSGRASLEEPEHLLSSADAPHTGRVGWEGDQENGPLEQAAASSEQDDGRRSLITPLGEGVDPFYSSSLPHPHSGRGQEGPSDYGRRAVGQSGAGEEGDGAGEALVPTAAAVTPTSAAPPPAAAAAVAAADPFASPRELTPARGPISNSFAQRQLEREQELRDAAAVASAAAPPAPPSPAAAASTTPATATATTSFRRSEERSRQAERLAAMKKRTEANRKKKDKFLHEMGSFLENLENQTKPSANGHADSSAVSASPLNGNGSNGAESLSLRPVGYDHAPDPFGVVVPPSSSVSSSGVAGVGRGGSSDSDSVTSSSVLRRAGLGPRLFGGGTNDDDDDGLTVDSRPKLFEDDVDVDGGKGGEGALVNGVLGGGGGATVGHEGGYDDPLLMMVSRGTAAVPQPVPAAAAAAAAGGGGGELMNGTRMASDGSIEREVSQSRPFAGLNAERLSPRRTEQNGAAGAEAGADTASGPPTARSKKSKKSRGNIDLEEARRRTSLLTGGGTEKGITSLDSAPAHMTGTATGGRTPASSHVTPTLAITLPSQQQQQYAPRREQQEGGWRDDPLGANALHAPESRGGDEDEDGGNGGNYFNEDLLRQRRGGDTWGLTDQQRRRRTGDDSSACAASPTAVSTDDWGSSGSFMNAGQYSVTFGQGTLGFTLFRGDDARAVVYRIKDKSSAQELGVRVGDMLESINKGALLLYEDIMGILPYVERPVLITFRRPSRQQPPASLSAAVCCPEANTMRRHSNPPFTTSSAHSWIGEVFGKRGGAQAHRTMGVGVYGSGTSSDQGYVTARAFGGVFSWALYGTSDGVEANGDSYTEYVMQCKWGRTEDQMASWMVARRYSEFDKLDKDLRDSFPALRSAIPPLPRKEFFFKTSVEVVARRRLGLMQYMSYIVANFPDLMASPLVDAFLHVSERKQAIRSATDALNGKQHRRSSTGSSRSSSSSGGGGLASSSFAPSPYQPKQPHPPSNGFSSAPHQPAAASPQTPPHFYHQHQPQPQQPQQPQEQHSANGRRQWAIDHNEGMTQQQQHEQLVVQRSSSSADTLQDDPFATALAYHERGLGSGRGPVLNEYAQTGSALVGTDFLLNLMTSEEAYRVCQNTRPAPLDRRRLSEVSELANNLLRHVELHLPAPGGTGPGGRAPGESPQATVGQQQALGDVVLHGMVKHAQEAWPALKATTARVDEEGLSLLPFVLATDEVLDMAFGRLAQCLAAAP